MSAENRKRAEEVVRSSLWDANARTHEERVAIAIAALTAAEERGRRKGVEQMRDWLKLESESWGDHVSTYFVRLAAYGAARLLSEGGTDG